MDKYDGYGNQTSVLQAPLFVSKGYYKDCNDSLKAKIEIEPNTDKPSDDDDIVLFEESFLDIEPNSGAVIRVAQKLLVSILLEKDELFDIKQDVFIPVNYVFRTCNLTSDGMEFLSDLKFAAKVKLYGIIIFSVLSIVFISLLIYCCKRKEKEELEENLISYYDDESKDKKVDSTIKDTSNQVETGETSKDQTNIKIN